MGGKVGKPYYSSYGYKPLEEGQNVTSRPEYPFILQMVKPGSKVLDICCGDGSLGQLLISQKGCKVSGLEIDKNGAEQSNEKGVETHIWDVDEGLPYPGNSFDYAIINVTLQMVYNPELVFDEAVRVSKRQIISFPNVAHLPARLEMLFLGRVPRTALFRHNWHNTKHIHHITYNDFVEFARKKKLNILKENRLWLRRGKENILSRAFPSLFCGLPFSFLKNDVHGFDANFW